MADTKYTVKLRADQFATVIECLDFLIAGHGERIRSSAIQGLDEFAHKRSRDQLAEIRDVFADIGAIDR